MPLKTWPRISMVLISLQVLLSQHGADGCLDGLNACFKYFDPRETLLGKSTGICELVSDQLDCLTMARLSCSGGGDTAPIDGAMQNMQSDYEDTPTSCTFDNIGQTPDYAVYQCTKLFGDCKATIKDTSCGLVDEYETCKEGVATFCSHGNLQNVTNFINSEKQRLTAEQGCVFVTTAKIELSGTDCFLGFQTCYEGQGVMTSSDPCVAAPVYQSCLQTDVINVCDAPATQTVASAVSSKQSECDEVTTTSTPQAQATTVVSTTSQISTTMPPPASTAQATPAVDTTPPIPPAASSTDTTMPGSERNATNNVEVKVTELGPGRLYLDFGNCASRFGRHLSLQVLCSLLCFISKTYFQIW